MNLLKRYLPVIVWCLAIFVVSSIPSVPGPKDTVLNFVLKKSAHVIEYAILYWLVIRAMFLSLRSANRRSGNPVPSEVEGRYKYLLPLVFVILYAVSDEIHQSFVPGRHARWYDIAFDTAGGLLSAYVIKKRSSKEISS